LGIEPDFRYSGSDADARLAFVHRKLRDGEIYFVRNDQARTVSTQAVFRVGGRVPELWHADTGRIERVSYRLTGERTIVPLQFDPLEAIFVVFRKPPTEGEAEGPAPPSRTLLVRLEGPWQLRFASGQGAPESAELPELLSWTRRPEDGIKYYSGTVSYRHSLEVPKGWLLQSHRIELDLGVVKDLAEVLVNGKSLGVLWKAPFRVDITDGLHAGGNQLEVRVTNTWVNRLIGDQQPGAHHHAFATFDPYVASSPLLDSGLLGPVGVNLLQ
jgi:hypothetical protein